MKKIFAIFITAALLTAALTACDNGGSGNDNDTTTTPAASESTSEPSDTSAPESSESTDSTEGTNEPSADGEASKILDAIKTAYGEDYLPDVPVEEVYLTSVLGLEEGSFTEFAGELPMISAHPDTAIIIKAADGKSGEVKAKLEAYRTTLIEDTMQYPMNVAKINASKVLENGDYLGFIILGAYGEDDASEEEAAAFAEEQVKIGVDAFNGYFG